MFIKTLYLITLPIFFIGCSSTGTVAPKSQDTIQKKFEKPKDNQSAIYIYRDSLIGFLWSHSIEIDGESLGKISNGTYKYKTITPGKHKVSSYLNYSSTVDMEGGKNYYFELKVSASHPSISMTRMPDGVAQKVILNCELTQ